MRDAHKSITVNAAKVIRILGGYRLFFDFSEHGGATSSIHRGLRLPLRLSADVLSR